MQNSFPSTAKRDTGGGYERASSQQLLNDDEVLDEGYKAKNDEKFRRYYEGGASIWEAEGKTRSQADFILRLYLLRLTNGDTAQVDRLFRRSGLICDKWDRRTGATTYGELTIRNALQKARA